MAESSQVYPPVVDAVGRVCGAVVAVFNQPNDMDARASQAAEEQYQAFHEAAAEYCQQGRKMVDDYSQRVEKFVRDEPLKALAVAVGVGMGLGLLLSRR